MVAVIGTAPEVLAIGGGPAGSTTAVCLAMAGVSVLVVDADPVDQAIDFDVLLTGQTTRTLDSLGLEHRAWSLPLVDVTITTDLVVDPATLAGPPASTVTGAAATSMSTLRAKLAGRAAALGVRRLSGRVVAVNRDDDGYDVTVETSDGLRQLRASHLVRATGARHGGSDGSAGGRGVVWAQRAVGGSTDRAVIALAPPAGLDPDDPPWCAWAVPGSNGSVTIATMSLVAGAAGPAASRLASAVELLARADTRLAGLRTVGPVLTAPIDAGYGAHPASPTDGIAVGEAAGLVNPFTGEGLSYALQSAVLAAEAIGRHRHDAAAAARTYRRRLDASMVGFFETAHHAHRRYHLAWRTLFATGGTDHPFLSKGRLALLEPQGLIATTTGDAVRVAPVIAPLTEAFLLACDEVAVSCVRTEWPFLARLVAGAHQGDRTRLRPALLFLGGLLTGAEVSPIDQAVPAAATELAVIGALAFLGSTPTSRGASRGVDWARATSVIAGDFLLSQASQLLARSAPQLSWTFSDWLEELITLRAARLTDPAGVSSADLFASLLEFPARVGAFLGGATDRDGAHAREIGASCGRLLLAGDETLALQYRRTRLDLTLPRLLDDRVGDIGRRTARAITAKDLGRDPELRRAAEAGSRRAATQAATAARAAMAGLSSGSARLVFAGVVDALESDVGP